MKKNLKWLLCLLSTIAIMYTGCASGGSDSESAECEVGKIYAEIPTDPIYKAAAELSKKLDPENQKYILFIIIF